MFLGFCCKVLLRKIGGLVRVLCVMENRMSLVLYVTIPILRAGDIHDRGYRPAS